MEQRVVTGGFIVKKVKFLLAKRADDDTFYPGDWEIPGGQLEFGEEANDGVLRELLEETGLEVEAISPVSVINYMNEEKNVQYIQINYLCKTQDDVVVKLSHEHSDYKWIDFEELSKFEMHPEMKKAIYSLKSHPLVEKYFTQTK